MKGRRFVGAGAVALACLAVACTDGTTPDCSDAQCGVISVLDASDAAGREASGVGAKELDAGPDAERDAARDSPSDAARDSGFDASGD